MRVTQGEKLITITPVEHEEAEEEGASQEDAEQVTEGTAVSEEGTQDN